jgi:ceramide glucosyltransferase
MLLFRIFAVLAALLTLQSVLSLKDGYRFLRLLRRSLRRQPGHYAPPAVLIVPCKGIDPDFDAHVARFLTQDYPDYEAIFVVAVGRDEAHARLARLLDGAHSPVKACRAQLVVAGHSEERGEKVNNLLAGLAAADPRTEVLVFADIDARARTDWLRSLVAPLSDSGVTVSTGFRWYLPGRSFASRLRAAWDTSIATLLGEHRHNFAWGGSMAMRATDFRRLEIAQRYWASTVSDDYGVTRAVEGAGGYIRFEPRCLLASGGECRGREFLEWANRQIILTRVYAPRLWAMGLASHALYGGTLLIGLALLLLPGSPAAFRAIIAILLVVILGLGAAKGWLRMRAARELFPEEEPLLRRYDSCYWRLTPLVPWVMLFNLVVAAVCRRIEWRGVRYELLSRNKVRVIARDD